MPLLPRRSRVSLQIAAVLLSAGCTDPAPAGEPVGAGVGLELADGALQVGPAYRLPQHCLPNERAAWDAAQGRWACSPATRAGGGLVHDGDALALADAYRLPQGCSAGELPVRMADGWACADNVGDGDTLASLRCAAGEVPKWEGAGWACAPDVDTRVAAGIGIEVDGNVVGLRSGYRLPQSCDAGQIPRWNGADWSCSDDVDTDTDTLAMLLCDVGWIPKWSGVGWACAPDEDTPVAAGDGLLVDGGRISLDPAYELPQACAVGQVPKWGGGTWFCADDIDTDLDTDTLASLACAAGAVPSWNGSAWTCGAVVQAGVGLVESGGTVAIDPRYRLPQTCVDGEVARWNGSSWICTSRGTITAVAAGTGLIGGAAAGPASLELDLTFTDSRYQARARRMVVIPPDATPTENGAALAAALASIAQAVPTANDPWLIRLEPGIYDVGTATLDLPPFVGISGAGADYSVIRGAAPSVLRMTGMGNTELRQLAVEQDALAPPAGQYVRAIAASGTRSLRMVDVKVVSTTTVAQHVAGVHSDGALLVLENCIVEAENAAGTGYATAISALRGNIWIRGGRFEASASVEAAGGSFVTQATIEDASFIAHAYDARGVQTIGYNSIDLSFRNTFLSGTTAFLFRPSSGIPAAASIERSRLEGSDNAIDVSSATVDVAYSRLVGGVSTTSYGRARCVFSAGPSGALSTDCL